MPESGVERSGAISTADVPVAESRMIMTTICWRRTELLQPQMPITTVPTRIEVPPDEIRRFAARGSPIGSQFSTEEAELEAAPALRQNSDLNVINIACGGGVLRNLQ